MKCHGLFGLRAHTQVRPYGLSETRISTVTVAVGAHLCVRPLLMELRGSFKKHNEHMPKL